MNAPERHTLFRFVLLYMGMFFLLFASLSFLYYQEQRHFLRDRFETEMRRIALSVLADQRSELPPGFHIVTGTEKDYPPNVLVPESDRLVLRIPSARPSERALTVVADIGLFDAADEDLRNRIIAFMLLGFVVNLAIALVLGWFSLQPFMRSNRKLKEFAQDVIHDLNAPVTAMKINLEALATECPSKRLRFVQLSLKQIRALYHNLELYLRDEYRSEAQKTDLARITREVVEPLREQYPDATFRIEVPSLTIEINPTAFERIVGNLVQNAVKYGGTHPVITIGLDEHKHFFIRDNGPGIANPDILLRRGQQADPHGAGQGLGLDIVRKLGESCHLPLQIRSEPGRGTTFAFDLSDRIPSRNVPE